MTVAFICSDDIQVGTFSGLVHEPEFGDHFRPLMVSLDRYYFGNFSSAWAQRYPHVPVYEMLGAPSPSADLRRLGLPAAWTIVIRHVLSDVERCLQELRPDVLVTTNDNGFVERLFIRAASRKGIPSVLVQEGIIAARSRSSRKDLVKMAITRWLLRPVGLEFLGTTRYGCGSCDILALYGNGAARILNRYGVRAERLRVVGSMRNDRVIEAKKNFERGRAAEQLGLNVNAAVHLILSTNILTGLNDRAGHLLLLQEIRAIHKVILECDPSAQIVVKLHPRDEIESYSDLAGLRNLKLIRDADLYGAILLSRVVYCSFSGAAYEAVALERPVLATALQFQKNEWHLAAISESPLEVVRDEVRLRSILFQLANPDEYQRFTQAQLDSIADILFVRPDETAARRFTAVLMESTSIAGSPHASARAGRKIETAVNAAR